MIDLTPYENMPLKKLVVMKHIHVNSDLANIWRKIRKDKHVTQILVNQQKQDFSLAKRQELQCQQRLDSINYLNKWQKFKQKKDIIIRDYVKACKLKMIATHYQKYIQTNSLLKAVLASFRNEIKAKLMRIKWRLLAICASNYFKESIRKAYGPSTIKERDQRRIT